MKLLHRWVSGDRGTLAANVGARVVALVALGVATVLVARTGGAAAVGILTLLRVLPGLFGVLVSGGLPGAAPYFLARTTSTGKTVSTLLVLTAISSALAALIWLLTAPVLHMVFFRGSSPVLVAAAAAAVATQLPVAVGKSLLQGSQDLRGANWAIAAEEVSFLPAYGVLLLTFHGTALLLAALVLADVLVVGWIIRRLASVGLLNGLERPDRALSREIVSYGLRGQVGGALSLLNLRFDFALLGALAGPAVLGTYAVASKYAELLRLPGLAATYVLYPRFTRQGTAVATERTRYQVPRMFAGTVVLGLPLALGSAVVLPLVYGSQFRPAVLPAVILVGGLLGEGVAGVLTAYIYSVGRPGWNSIAMGVGVVITVVLDLVLIPRYGAVGAAAASAVAYVASTAALLVMFDLLGRRTGTEVPDSAEASA